MRGEEARQEGDQKLEDGGVCVRFVVRWAGSARLCRLCSIRSFSLNFFLVWRCGHKYII